ncbi:retrovirus-related Pol polyprotein from transposon opus [Trichonephila inaurata madagascariensis]|uniref:Retrovirus-related Pol polyprotein from transposon opus n=1 Tax=Trichonephila inaurata madagascariensis TaxID=2747483 RepID=A0A8X6YY64_9ARAC|nr:retrovirus-related Pol polyprotein from transposon opus [Trichonephila inaurata madagascariensis]
MITDQLEATCPGDVKEQFVDNWVKINCSGDLADKLDEDTKCGANVKGAHSNDTRKAKLPIELNTGTSRGFKPKCFICVNVGHLARECPKNTRKTPPRNTRSNIITAKGTELESLKEVITARVSVPVSVPINTRKPGTNFTAEMTEAFKDVLGIASRFATPGHPESMGLCLTIPTCLWSTTKQPIETIKGGLDWWQGNSHCSKSIGEYLRDLTEKWKQAHNLARGNSEKVQAEYASRYNLRSREKRLAVGDQVLVLIPSSSHKLLKKWMGPATIIELPRPHTASKMEDGE